MASYILIAQANVTAELEERTEVLEDTVEEVENEDALINVRLFDVEMDVFENENSIEGESILFKKNKFSAWAIRSL